MSASLEAVYREVDRILREGGPAALCTVVRSSGSTPAKAGAKMLVRADGSTLGTIGGGCPEAEVWSLAREVMESGEARSESYRLTAEETGGSLVCGGTIEVFVEPLVVPYLYVFGGGHVTREIERLAGRCGFAVVVAGDRPGIVSRESYPDAREILVGPYEEVLSDLRPRGRPRVVSATHTIDADVEVLAWALRSRVDWIGLLASRAKRAVAIKRLLALGFPPGEVERIRAPLGIPIGARSPAEIAVSVVAELIADRRGVEPFWPRATGREKALRRGS
jgi:xanthine dehydrogenase accessory factor